MLWLPTPRPRYTGAMPDGTTPPPALGTATFTLANVVTMLRLCAVPVAVWLVLRGQFLAAFWLFAAAGLLLPPSTESWLSTSRRLLRQRGAPPRCPR